MPVGSVTEITSLQLATQPIESSDGLVTQHIEHVASAKGPASDRCKTLACWEVNVAVMFMVLAGFLILALFYCVLLLRHKLRLAQAGNALEYFGFYHMANYSLKHHEPLDLSPVDSNPPVVLPPRSPLLTVVPSHPIVPPLLPPLPPPHPSRPPSIVPLPLPIIYTTPPSPQSDAEVYSRIGPLRPSRHSSMSQTQVVLFEHSSL